MKKLILYIFLTSIVSCEPGVVFDKPMPPDTSSIDEIPSLFTGTFMCESDSSRIYIFDRLAIRETKYIFYTTLDQVRETENCSILVGGLYLPGRAECIPFTYITADSIRATIYNIDTLFAFRHHEVAKIYKGHLFLNQMDRQKNWITWMLSPETDGGMYLELINVPDRINSVEGITSDFSTRKTRKEETQYIINPKLIEFDKILEKGYVQECDYLTPISIENEISKFRL